MAWISKKELKKELTELRKKVSELDSKKFPEELPEDIKEQIRGIVRGETELLSSRLNGIIRKVGKQDEKIEKLQKDLKTTDAQLIELTGKVKKFISLTRQITKTLIQDIWNKLKEALGEDFFEEKPEEPTKPEHDLTPHDFTPGTASPL